MSLEDISAPGGAGEARADEVFVASLQPRPGGRIVHGLRLVGAFLAQLLLQLLPSPSVHDVVVHRRDDGTEVLRVPAGDPLVSGDLLAYVQQQLDSLDAESFVREWEAARPRKR